MAAPRMPLLIGDTEHRFSSHGRGLRCGRKPLFEAPEQLAKPAVAVTAGMDRAVFLLQDLQGHAWPLQFDSQRAPIGLHPSAQSLLDALSGE